MPNRFCKTRQYCKKSPGLTNTGWFHCVQHLGNATSGLRYGWYKWREWSSPVGMERNRKKKDKNHAPAALFFSEKKKLLKGGRRGAFHCNIFATEQAVVKKPWAENPTLGAHSKPTQDGSHLGPDISLLGTLCHTSQVWWCQTHRAQLCTTSCRRQGRKGALGVSGATDVKSPWETVTWERLLSVSKAEAVSQRNQHNTQSCIHLSRSPLSADGHSSLERSWRQRIARVTPHQHSGQLPLLQG